MSMESLCRLLGYSKQAYYKRLNYLTQCRFDEALIIEMIERKRIIWKKGSGRNLHASLQGELKKHRIKMGRDKFYDLLRRHHLLNPVRKYRTKTTFSYHHFHKYPNIIKEVVVNRANQVIVSDVTYIWLRDAQKFCYLFLITDMYSRKILGYHLSEDLKSVSALTALKMAVNNMSNVRGCIHHSDRGIQYCSTEYVACLKRQGMLISMTENGDPLENSIAERINRTIKEEFTRQRQLSFRDFSEARRRIALNIKFYNEERPHRSIDMLTPSVAYTKTGQLKRKWKAYYSKEKNPQQLTAVGE